MASALTAAVTCVVLSAATSLLIYLPAVAFAESLPPRRAQARAAVWLSALLIPALVGVTGGAVGVFRVIHDKYGSPHLTAERPHLCSRWLLEMPDARWIMTLVGAGCSALILLAFASLGYAALRSCLLARRFRMAAPAPGEPVVLPSTAPELVTVGLLSPVTVVTEGTRSLLTPDELAAALAHEGAHAQRRDNVAEVVAQACTWAIAFVPTAHLYLRYWREAVEMACDWQAASATSPAAVASAIGKLLQAAGEKHAWRLSAARDHWPRRAAQARARIALLTADPEQPTPQAEHTIGGWPWLLAGILVLALGLIATGRQVNDTLYCLVESVLTVLGRP